jgi:hypothetical protein
MGKTAETVDSVSRMAEIDAGTKDMRNCIHFSLFSIFSSIFMRKQWEA